MGVWHTLRREVTGACRSVRYDLDHHRATKLAGAFTEEFEPAPEATGSRVIPLAGVALLLAGGAAGAFLAITGGLAALGTDDPLAADRPGVAVSAPPNGYPRADDSPTARRPVPRRPANRRSPSPTPAADLAGSPGPAGRPSGVPEGSALPSRSPHPSQGSSPAPPPPPPSTPAPSVSVSPPTTGVDSDAPGPGR